MYVSRRKLFGNIEQVTEIPEDEFRELKFHRKINKMEKSALAEIESMVIAAKHVKETPDWLRRLGFEQRLALLANSHLDDRQQRLGAFAHLDQMNMRNQFAAQQQHPVASLFGIAGLGVSGLLGGRK